MAANLDKAESSLTAVSDVAYIRAVDSSGNSVRISKADLASVLGVVSKVSCVANISAPSDLNNATDIGSFVCSNNVNTPTGTGGFGLLIVFKRNADIVQVFFPTGGTIGVQTRRRTSGNIWSDWF